MITITNPWRLGGTVACLATYALFGDWYSMWAFALATTLWTVKVGK